MAAVRPLFALTVCAALLLTAAGLAQTTPPADPAKAGSVAYPDNPSSTPQAENAGAPVVTDKAACASGTECPDKPAPSASADTGSTGARPKAGGVETPATAYPDGPVKTPAADDESGTAPKP